MNHEIRLSPINLIDQDGKSIGEIDTRDAMRMAEEAGLDLVEIQANVRPPLCKIMDYGKYKYELSKKQKGQKSKAQELKEVRLGRSAKIDPHDVGIRVNQARKFLMQGHKVQIVQRFRGREMQHKDIGLDRLKDIAQDLSDISKIEAPPRQAGRQMSMLLSPDKQRIETIKRKLDAEKAKDGVNNAEDTQVEDAPIVDDARNDAVEEPVEQEASAERS
ncbi:MAG: translation initiation factor IF-3 [Planctomycetota bacterium]